MWAALQFTMCFFAVTPSADEDLSSLMNFIPLKTLLAVSWVSPRCPSCYDKRCGLHTRPTLLGVCQGAL